MTLDNPAESSAEMVDRAFLISELQRLKDDVSELFNRMATLKDSMTTDKLALLAQLNTEFTQINAKFSEVMLKLSAVLGQHDAASASSGDKLALLRSELDNRLLQFRMDLKLPPDYSEQIKKIEETAARAAKQAAVADKKVTKLSWQIGLIIGVVMFLLNSFGVDFIKGLFNKSPVASPPAQQFQSQPISPVSPQATYDTTTGINGSGVRTSGGR
jgi:hypothetical protein